MIITNYVASYDYGMYKYVQLYVLTLALLCVSVFTSYIMRVHMICRAVDSAKLSVWYIKIISSCTYSS